MAWRVYRPGMVVGDSQTGEMDKIDGPYYFFNSIRQISKTVPSWIPAIMVKGGELNIVPVDFVVNSLDYLAHLPKHDHETFHLTEPEGTSVGELIQLLLKTAHGPSTLVWDNGVINNLSKRIPINQLVKMSSENALTKRLMKQLGIPADVLKFVSYPTHFDSDKTAILLAKGGISCPAPEDYFDVIWAYWEQHLASGKNGRAGLNLDNTVKKMLGRSNSQRLRKAVEGKVVVVTGATSGIGLDCATKLSHAGATVILAARTPEKLDEEVKKLRKEGGDVYAYPCDISDMADCDKFVATVLKNHDHVDVLINNAGRSIRRSVKYSFDRFHDYERTMQLNYFGALRLIMGFSPKMLERKTGQIVNISSIGVLASPPRFSAYVASKAALDAFSVCAASEFADSNVRFTTINMPLVRTPMIAPTKMYDAFPTLSPDQAANLVMNSIVDKPKRVATGMGLAGALGQAVAPKVTEFFLNQAYHLFPDSAAARGLTPEEAAAEKAEAPSSALAIARRLFSQTLRGYHW
jgi:NAD(P)-dependent dehydrogenase (short-subunit alcohol dehydrogenase family)